MSTTVDLYIEWEEFQISSVLFILYIRECGVYTINIILYNSKFTYYMMCITPDLSILVCCAIVWFV